MIENFFVGILLSSISIQTIIDTKVTFLSWSRRLTISLYVFDGYLQHRKLTKMFLILSTHYLTFKSIIHLKQLSFLNRESWMSSANIMD